MPGKARCEPLLQDHHQRFVQGIEQMHGGEDALRPLERSTARGRLVWLRLPGEEIAKDGATRFAALLHDSPGPLTHRHISMPDGGPIALWLQLTARSTSQASEGRLAPPRDDTASNRNRAPCSCASRANSSPWYTAPVEVSLCTMVTSL